MIHLLLKQSWVEKSNDTALEEFKSALADYLNSQVSDRHADERWSISKVSEGGAASLIYDEEPIASITIKDHALHIESNGSAVARYDDLMYYLRLVAGRLGFACYSQLHGGARLPIHAALALDHTYFEANSDQAKFFVGSGFTPRFCVERYEEVDGKGKHTISAPYYLEKNDDGTIHLANPTFLDYLIKKADQLLGDEFSYQVADSMNDFAQKYDFGLIPYSFYRSFKRDITIINDTDFNIDTIDRKIFIDPYVWDFDVIKNNRFYDNVENGLHYMDRIRAGETLRSAVQRVLKDELGLNGDFVGIRIWGLDVDRDREGVLTPRLKLNIYVHGLSDKHRSDTHDWVSVKK